MDINERIFELLKQQNQTAKDLGEFIGVKSSSISAWKNSGSYPSSKYIVRISEYLNVSPTFLLTGSNENSSLPDLAESELEILKIIHPLSDKDRVKVIGIIENYLANRASSGSPIQPIYLKEDQIQQVFNASTKKPL